ncbi:hypothetical protein [Flammeovirga agarivorans]|uniref:Uncharacterized protein n=1 Tax=Flammeovirga agarivorans TaxID=2726742 RepID=A0A7X8XYX9_9BACT|nr:hypothetical protein [Flammeovirga agarivorans]NLR94445.1 hypothetical protein [Flammeovirga agarivorans]
MKKLIIASILTLFTLLSLPSFNTIDQPLKDAETMLSAYDDGKYYMVTWQNDKGYWFGIGPMQNLWAGEESEEKAIKLIKSSAATKWSYLGNCGKYRVYKCDKFNSWDENTIKKAQKKGFSMCF